MRAVKFAALMRPQAQNPRAFPFRGERRGLLSEGANDKSVRALTSSLLESVMGRPPVPRWRAYRGSRPKCQQHTLPAWLHWFIKAGLKFPAPWSVAAHLWHRHSQRIDLL